MKVARHKPIVTDDIAIKHCVFLNSTCSHYNLRHRWIGFRNTISACGCGNDDCTACRAQWSWTDGSSKDNYTNWQGSNPQSGEIYALLEQKSVWHGFSSTATLKFICKTREYYVGDIRQSCSARWKLRGIAIALCCKQTVSEQRDARSDFTRVVH